MGATTMCVRCHGLADPPVLVGEVHQASGPGFNAYACADCAPGFPPVPDVLDLFPRRRGTEAEAGTGEAR
ncbi:hypothetical protein ABZY68_18225 [Streptomyces sp. NPDC006482]|uniref:hypothetical protein n=1 Tax=Streptomyces sp. NPDC006482 TaxID=3154306 RepID=UPI0033BF2CD9